MKRLFPVFLTSLALACTQTGTTTDAGSNSDGDAGVESPYVDYVVDGCEHMNEGPDLPTVTAVADVAALGGDAGTDTVLSVEHGRTTINLVPFQGAQGGYLSFSWAPAGADAQLWIAVEQEGVTLEVLHMGSAHAPTASIPRDQLPAGCGSDPRKVGHLYVFELSAGEYTLRVGPTSNTSISVVAVDSSEEE
ncbi:MAG: hypothetical protein AB2A00_08895 [Myxococcota bacterium]